MNAKKTFKAILLITSACVTAIGAKAQPGTLDRNFNPGEGAGYGSVYQIVIQPGERILVSGDFSNFSGVARHGLARLHTNGLLDATFQPQLDTNSEVYAVAIQPADGKILIGGYFDFTPLAGATPGYLARLSPDGVLDTTLTIDADDSIYCLVANGDGRNYLGGDFWYLSKGATDYSRNCAARFGGNTINNWNAGGTDEDQGPDGAVYAMAVQSNGTVLIGGDFTSITDGPTVHPRQGVARLTSLYGRLDDSFNPGAGADNTVYALVIQPDGKLLVGGSFTNFNYQRHAGIVRLNPDGSVDPGFAPQVDLGGSVYAMALQPDGKILLGGDFVTVNGHRSVGLARLHSSGAVDTTFVSGDNVEEGDSVMTIALQSDGQILIGGDFITIAGEERAGIARINGDRVPVLTTQPASRFALVGNTVQFTAAAAGSGTLTYQWYQDNEPLLEGGRFQGVKSSTLTINNTQLDEEGVYTVCIGNSIGSVMSREAMLSVGTNDLRLASPTISNGFVEFQTRGAGPGWFIVSSSLDLKTWVPVLTNQSPVDVIRLPVGNQPHQFFRCRFEP